MCKGILCFEQEKIGENVVVHEISLKCQDFGEFLLYQEVRILQFDVFLLLREENIDLFSFTYHYFILTLEIYDLLIISKDVENSDDSSLCIHKTQLIIYSLEKQSAIASK